MIISHVWALPESNHAAGCSQAYNTTLYWEYADWYATGFSATTEIHHLIDYSYQLTGLDSTLRFKTKLTPVEYLNILKIKYSIPLSSNSELSPNRVRITVYDILGRKVKTLVNKFQKPGNYEVNFNGGDLNSGVYFYELRVGNFRSVKKMMLLK